MKAVKAWIGGLISAAAGGAAGAFGGGLVDPDHFNLSNPHKMIELGAICAIPAVLGYLKKSPLPDVEENGK